MEDIDEKILIGVGIVLIGLFLIGVNKEIKK